MQILKNYKKIGMYQEFPLIKLKQDEDVFIDLPLCVVEYGVLYECPVIFQEKNKIGVVIEKEELIERLKSLKLFYFLINEKTGEVKEVEPSLSNLTIRLPKDVDVSKLEFHNNEIYLVEQEEVKE